MTGIGWDTKRRRMAAVILPSLLFACTLGAQTRSGIRFGAAFPVFEPQGVTLNGQDVTHLFNPVTPAGFETVAIPLRPGRNRLKLKVKGGRNGRPATEVDHLDFVVGDPPLGPRPR